MEIHVLEKKDTLEIQDVLKNRFFLRFLSKYQQRYSEGKRKKYKHFPKTGRSQFSQEFYEDIYDVFSDTQEFHNFCAEFREEMILRQHIWQKIQEDFSYEDFKIGILTFLRIYLKKDENIKTVVRTKVRDIMKEAEETVNEVNGLNLGDSIQLGRENGLFPIDSAGDFIIFLSKNGDHFDVFRQMHEQFASVDKMGKIIKIHTPEIDLFGPDDSREELLRRKEQFEFFLKIYKAFSGQIEEEISIPTDDFDIYGDLIEKWIETQEDLIPQEGVDIFTQEEGKWGDIFQSFLEESIKKLEQKTKRAHLTSVQ